MSTSSVPIQLYRYFASIGVATHEISHFIAVSILPNVSVTEFNILDHVEHEGHYTFTKMFLISYAPLILNTAISFSIFTFIFETELNAVTDYVLAVVIALIGSSIALRALPSYVDCVNPLRMLRESLFTIRFPIVVLTSVVAVPISIPFLVLSYVAEKSVLLDLLVQITYLIVIVSVASGLLDPYSVLLGFLSDFDIRGLFT